MPSLAVSTNQARTAQYEAPPPATKARNGMASAIRAMVMALAGVASAEAP